jgi:hypothetical protein
LGFCREIRNWAAILNSARLDSGATLASANAITAAS